MRNNLYPIITLIILHLVFLLPLTSVPYYQSHDGELHIARIAAYAKALIDGQFPVRWAPDLNYGYGTPVFTFYYPLPYVLGSILHFAGLSFTESFKTLIGLAFLLSPVSFYLWMRRLTKPWIAAAAALFYGLAPYHFLDTYVRGALGELFAFAIIPLIFLAIEDVRLRSNGKGWIWGGFAYSLLLLSHNSLALAFTPVFIFYSFLRLPTFKQKLRAMGLLGLGLGLSAFFWIPAITHGQYTHANLFIGAKYKFNFPGIWQLIVSAWGFGTEVTKPGGLSPQIGPIHVLLVFLSLFAIKRLKSLRWLFMFGLTLFLLTVFFSTYSSVVFWDAIPYLQKFEFPWRMTAISSFAAGILSVIVFSSRRGSLLAALTVAGLLFSSIPLTSLKPSDAKPDAFYETYAFSTDFGAAATIWAAGDPTAAPKTPVEVIAGDARITGYWRKGTIHSYAINSKSTSKILDNTLYFPGWNVYVDRQESPIQFQDPNHRGLITFAVPQGIHTVRVVFEETRMRQLANAISLLSLGFAIVLLIRPRLAGLQGEALRKLRL